MVAADSYRPNAIEQGGREEGIKNTERDGNPRLCPFRPLPVPRAPVARGVSAPAGGRKNKLFRPLPGAAPPRRGRGVERATWGCRVEASPTPPGKAWTGAAPFFCQISRPGTSTYRGN